MNSASKAPSLKILHVDYRNDSDCIALLHLLNLYALDPMGGGEALGAQTMARLCPALAARPDAVSFIAWRNDNHQGEQPVGLLNGFVGFSTFKAQPLLNIHDICVHPTHRGQGIGQALLDVVQTFAIMQGCCKLTLEVLSGNHNAIASYERFGFANFELNPAIGQAQFMQKWL